MARLIPFLLLIASTSVYASFDLGLLKSLLNSGQVEKAYNYAASEVADHEGTPEFDYYYGIAAIDSGHASEGVFALERVLALDPDNHAARLELARGYFVLEEYARARQEFETVLTVNPPEDVVDRVNLYLDAITTQEGRYQTTQTAFIEFGLGSDSNANSGPDITSYNIGILNFPLDTNSQEQDDNFAELKLSYKISTPVSPKTSYFLAIDGDFHNNDDNSQFDTRTYTLDTGFKFLQAQNVYTVDLFAQQFELNGDDYRLLTGLNSSWLHNLTQQSTVQLYLQFAQQDYERLETRDANTISLGSSYSKRFSATFSPVLIAGFYLAHDDPKLDTNAARQNTERDYYGAQLGTILGFSQSLSAKLSINYQDSEYGMASTITGQTRQDDYLSAALKFNWRVARNWGLSAKASVAKNNSNNVLFEYDRALFSVNLRYKVK